jgi:hypothetical protein
MMRAILATILFSLSAVAGFYPVNRGMINQATVVTTAGSTTTLVATSNQVYIFEGSQEQTVKLPNATGLPNDWFYDIFNNGSESLSFVNNGSTALFDVSAGRSAKVILKDNSTANGTWKYHLTPSTIESIDVQVDDLTVINDLNVGDTIQATGNITGANLSGTNTGDVTIGSPANGLSMAAGQVLTLATANSTTIGALSSTDWTTFNNKQASGNYITALTGDVTASGPGSVAATIADDSVTNAKAANMAQSTIKGRAAGAGTGDPTDLTATQATAILDAMVGDSGSGGTKGLVPAPASGDAAANKFLKANGTWATTSGGGTAYAWSGYHVDNCVFTRAQTALGDPAIDSSCTFTERYNDGFGTVTSRNDGTPGNNYPGLVVASAPATGRLKICASFSGTPTTNGNYANWQLYDVTGSADMQNEGNYSSTAMVLNHHLCGYKDVTASSSYTFTIRSSASGGDASISPGAALGLSIIEWTMELQE